MSSAREDLLVMTPDATVAAAVDAALSANGRVWTKAVVREPRDMLFHMGRSAAAVIVADLDPQPSAVLPELERISARHPATRVVALASAFDQQLLLGAMQSGVRQLLLKQQIGLDLAKLLARLTAGDVSQAAQQGNLFVVLSSGGGCGATTLAANLAEELGSAAHQPTLLIDLDVAYGTLPIMLGVEQTYGIDHVLSHQGTIDADLIRSTASRHSDHVHVLASPVADGLPSYDLLRSDRLGQVLDVATQGYGNVVVDAPRVPSDVAARLVSASTRTLLVLQLTVKDVRVARAMLATLTEHGASAADLILPVVARYAKRRHMVSLEDASEALGGLPIECLRNDYAGASQAMDLGQMLSVAAPRSPLRRDIQALAGKLVAAPVAAAGRGT